jgi:hypothetical protein
MHALTSKVLPPTVADNPMCQCSGIVLVAVVRSPTDNGHAVRGLRRCRHVAVDTAPILVQGGPVHGGRDGSAGKEFRLYHLHDGGGRRCTVATLGQGIDTVLGHGGIGKMINLATDFPKGMQRRFNLHGARFANVARRTRSIHIRTKAPLRIGAARQVGLARFVRYKATVVNQLIGARGRATQAGSRHIGPTIEKVLNAQVNVIARRISSNLDATVGDSKEEYQCVFARHTHTHCTGVLFPPYNEPV